MHKRIGLNSLWLLLARLGTQVFSLTFVALVAWHLGVAGFGQFSVMAALVFLGNAITTFGTDTLIMRDIARNGRPTALVNESFWLQSMLVWVWLMGQQAILWLVAAPEAMQRTLFVYTISLWPLALYTVCSAALRGVERMDLFLLLSLLGSALQVLAAIVVILVLSDMVTLVLGLVVVQFVMAGVAWWLCRMAVPGMTLGRLPGLAALFTLLRTAAPLSLLTGLAILSQRTGLFVVSLAMGDTGAGIFSASSRIAEGLKVGHQSVLGALMPGLLKRDGHADRLFRLALWTMPLAAAGLALAASLLAAPVVKLIYGSSYEAAAGVLVVMSWGLVPYALNAVLSLALVAHGAESALARTTLAALLLSVVLMAGLVIQFGLIGAAWGIVAGEVIQAGFLILTYRTARLHPQAEPVPYGF